MGAVKMGCGLDVVAPIDIIFYYASRRSRSRYTVKLTV